LIVEFAGRRTGVFVKIHPTAIVDPSAQLGREVTIGPFSIVGRDVIIGDRVVVGNNVLIEKNTTIGAGCRIFTGAVLGTQPQDLKYKGEKTFLEIGENTIIREYVTVHLGTEQRGKTTIGSQVMLMAYVHVAHDCDIGDRVILANAVNMAGHVEIGEYATVGGVVPIHQFVKIGPHAMIGGGFRVNQDVCPFMRVAGYPLRVVGVNLIGLERRGFSQEAVTALKKAHKILFRSKLNVSQATEKIARTLPQSEEIKTLLEFISRSDRGIIR
jgi:UDP-N-acetylglucosamine acyltransferase